MKYRGRLRYLTIEASIVTAYMLFSREGLKAFLRELREEFDVSIIGRPNL